MIPIYMFSYEFWKFIRTPILQNICKRLVLSFKQSWIMYYICIYEIVWFDSYLIVSVSIKLLVLDICEGYYIWKKNFETHDSLVIWFFLVIFKFFIWINLTKISRFSKSLEISFWLFFKNKAEAATRGVLWKKMFLEI